MVLSAQRISNREKLILAGLYLSKYDSLVCNNLVLKALQRHSTSLGMLCDRGLPP